MNFNLFQWGNLRLAGIDINPWLIIAAIGLGLTLLLFFGWRREMRRRTAQTAERTARERDNALRQAALNAPLPPGAAPIKLANTGAGPIQGADHSGRIILVLVGTFAENVGKNLLLLLHHAGLEGALGSILLLELDVRRRERFMAQAPSVFRDRIIEVGFAGTPGGEGNRPPEEVHHDIGYWGPSVVRGAEEACELHQRRQHGQEPAVGLVFVSQGGQATIGALAVDTIARYFPTMRLYGCTTIPTDDRLRERVPAVLEAYRKVGVHGFVISDNLQDEVRSDYGMIAAVAGFMAASENADAAVEFNNALYQLFQKAPGGLVTYSTWVRNVPGYLLTPTHPAAPSRYYVYQDSIQSAMFTGLKQVERAEFDSVGGVGRNGQVVMASRFDIALAAVEALKAVEDNVILGRHLTGNYEKRNAHLLIAPIGTTIDDPARPRCPVVVVSLRALSDPPSTLQELTLPSQPVHVSQPSANGHVKSAADAHA